MKRKISAFLMIFIMLTALLTGCSSKTPTKENNSGSSADSGKEATENATEPEEITMAFVTFNNLPSDTKHVEDAINAIIEKKINTRIKLEVYSVANYREQISLRISSGEDLGLIQTLGDLNQYVSKKMIIPLDSLLDTYGDGIKKAVPADFLNCTMVDGMQYAIPANKGVAFAPCFVYDAEMMDTLGISAEDIHTINDLDKVFSAITEKYPNVYPIAPANSGDIGALDVITNLDFLTDDLFTAKGVLLNDSQKVENLYESDEFKKLIGLTREWYNKGYISKDASTTTTLASEAINSGQAFSYIGLYSGDPAAVSMQLSNMIGKKVSAVRIGDPYISTTNVNAVSWGIPVSCKHPEAAMKFLDLLYSDPEILNMVLYGVEGVDHVKADDKHIAFPEGQTAQTVSYCPMSSAMVGNQFLAYLLPGQSPENLTVMEKENQTAARSNAFGFTFNSDKVATQYTSVSNVLNKYLPGLRCGSLDPEKYIQEFNSELKSAGIDDIIAEKQKQLDTWRGAK